MTCSRPGSPSLAGKVQLSVKAFYEEEALLRGVVEGSPTIARLRERVRGLSPDAGYYERIRLGELVSAEVERARERDAALVLGRLEPLAVDAANEPISTPDSAVNAAFLVERSRMDEFSAAVARLGKELEGSSATALRRSAASLQLRRRRREAGGAGMGLISGLLTLPLAPVRGTAWVAERLLEQAEAEFYDERAIRAQLLDIEAARDAGAIDEEDAARAEDELLERLLAARS